MSNFTQIQCDWATNVAKTAAYTGLDRERMLEILGTAWDVVFSEREVTKEAEKAQCAQLGHNWSQLSPSKHCLRCGEPSAERTGAEP